MLLLIVVIMTLLLLETTPVLVHLLHIHEEAAFAACGRSNLHTTILLVQITLLLVQKLRWWCERRNPAPQPLAHAQSPLVTVHGVGTMKRCGKQRRSKRFARFFSSRSKSRTFFDSGNFILAAALTAGRGGGGRDALCGACRQKRGTSSSFSRSFSLFLASI